MPVSFKLPDVKHQLLKNAEATNGAAVAYAGPNQIPKEKRFTPMGDGCPVSCRASIVRIAFMKLLGTGFLAMFMAASVKPDLAYSCALAAGVNAVAAVHYAGIWAIRAQVAPSAYTPFMSKVGGDAADDGLRLMTQELAVDGLRHSDWTVTLVLMTIDMWKIAEHANPNGTAILPSHWCAALQPVIIFFGSIPRFYLNECRFQRGLEGMPQRVAPWAWIIGALSFLIATTLFSVCAASLVEFIWDDGTPSDVNMRLSDAYVMTILMLLQIGYPLVFLFSTVYMHLCSGDWRSRGGDYPAWLSFYKDMAYGSLDILCKGGLALYAATRAMYVV